MKKILTTVFICIMSVAGAQVPVQSTVVSEPSYTLPDPLLSEGGKVVRNRRQWEKLRRPELLAQFQREMFGIMPPGPSELCFDVRSEDKEALSGKATKKEVDVYLDASRTLSMKLLMFIPNDRKGPVPAFLGANFKGNEATMGVNARRWPFEYIVSRGYAVITFAREDVDPDRHDGFADGVHGLLDKGKERTPESWGTIAAWAWGLSRAMDYLEHDSDIDSRRVAVLGHSRLGKTALWAGAVDQRFAMVISNDSGCSGAAISRRCSGETLTAINTRFPHWFCENYHKYNDNENLLPFDQHELVALIAPRPVYVASASEDLWADPLGEMLSLVHASCVYELYGNEPFTVSELPPAGAAVRAGRMGYHLREGRHDIMLFDWEHFISFADKFLK